MTRLRGLLKPSPRFEAGVANLNELVGERNVRPNQDIAVGWRNLHLRHRSDLSLA
jgi:hypothetical protein